MIIPIIIVIPPTRSSIVAITWIIAIVGTFTATLRLSTRTPIRHCVTKHWGMISRGTVQGKTMGRACNRSILCPLTVSYTNFAYRDSAGDHLRSFSIRVAGIWAGCIGGGAYGGATVSALKRPSGGYTDAVRGSTVHAGIGAEMTNGSAVLVKVAVSTLDGRRLRQLGVQHTLELLVVKTLLHHQLFELLDAFFLNSLLFSGLIPEARPPGQRLAKHLDAKILSSVASLRQLQ